MVNPTQFNGFSGPGGQPTEAERRLIEATALGTAAECQDLSTEARLVSAELITALATAEFRHADWPDWQPSRRGIHLVGARFTAPLILGRQQVVGDLGFRFCSFARGINIDTARVEGDLSLTGCIVDGGCSMAGAVIQGHVEAYQAQFSNPGHDCLNADRLESAAWYLAGSTFDGRISLQDSRIEGIVYAADVVVDGTDDHAIHAAGMRCAGWTLDRARLRGRINLHAATIRGTLYAAEAEFLNPGGIALFAAEADTTDWALEGAKFEGLVSFRDARLEGQFSAPGASFDNGDEDALQADRVRSGDWLLADATVNGSCSLNGAHIGNFRALKATFNKPGDFALWARDVRASGWVMDDAVVRGGFVFSGALIEGQFLATGALFEHPGNTAIWAQRARADDWNLFRASVVGMCDISGAEISASMIAMDATFTNPGGIALQAASAKIGNWSMTQARIEGGIDVNGARFEGAFRADGVVVDQTPYAAINGQSAKFLGGITLSEGASLSGEIDLYGATIAQQLDLSNAMFSGGRHRAVRLQDARVTGEVTLRGSRLVGHFHANRIRVEGRIDLKGAEFVSASLARSRQELPETLAPAANTIDIERQERYQHHAIVLQEARIDGRLVMPDRCPEGIVDLSRAQCDTLEDDHRGWPSPLAQNAVVCDQRLCVTSSTGTIEIQHLVLDGFEYRYLEFPAGRPDEVVDIARARSDWLAGQSLSELKTHFNPQPWLQAASVLRAMGHDEEAQELAIARRVRQRLAQSTPRFRRLVSWLLHLVSDYGFNPWKTVRISTAGVLLFAAAYWGLVHACDGSGVWTHQAGSCGEAPVLLAVRYGDVQPRYADRAYPRFEPVAYSLDTFVPFLDLGSEGYWRANTLAYAGGWPVGWILYILVMIERFLGATLLAIAVTGFTGLLTRDER